MSARTPSGGAPGNTLRSTGIAKGNGGYRPDERRLSPSGINKGD
jgi:hypothetical protein